MINGRRCPLLLCTGALRDFPEPSSHLHPPPGTTIYTVLQQHHATPCTPSSSPRSSCTPQLAPGMLFCFQEEPWSPSCPRPHSHGLDVCRWHPCDSPAPCSPGTCDQAQGPHPSPHHSVPTSKPCHCKQPGAFCSLQQGARHPCRLPAGAESKPKCLYLVMMLFSLTAGKQKCT